MRTMARAAVFISPIFKSALFHIRTASRPPPDEPLERRPSPLIALELVTGLSEKQVPRVAAPMVVSLFIASALLLSCGDSTDIRATQVAFMATRAVEEGATNRNDSWRQYDAKQDRLRELLTLRLKPSDPRIGELHDAILEIPGSFVKCGDGLCFLQLDMRVKGAEEWATATSEPIRQVSAHLVEEVTARGVTFLCYDISANYRIHSDFGHSEALDFVQIGMNLETDGQPYIRPSDARDAWEACR